MATVRKRVRTAASGEEKVAWVADYFDQHKKRHLKTFATQKAAKAWLVATQGEVMQGTHTPERSSITVMEAAERWLEHGRAEGHEKSTMRGYDAIVRLHIGPTLGAAKLAHLATPMLNGWRDRLLLGTPNHPAVTRHRARKVLSVFKSILKWAHANGLIAQNPAVPVSIKLKDRDREKLEVGVNVPGKPDIQKILAAAKGHHRALIVTAIFTGMRASELRGLAWDAVDFDKKTITVRQRADEWGTIGSPKSGAGRRDIPMSPMVTNTLREWQGRCPKGELNLVFPNTLGKVEPLSNIANRVWRPLQVELGLVDVAGEPRFTFHTLRHFYASWQIEQGHSPKRLQALLGHSTIAMTMDRYGHLFPNPEDEHEKLAEAERQLLGLVA